LRAILNEAPDDAIICFAPGRYRYDFFLERSVTLRGEGPGVIFRGDGGPNITVARAINVHVENVTLAHGIGHGGGNVEVMEHNANVVLSKCSLTFGRGGTAAYVQQGRLTLDRCVISRGEGARADAAVADTYGTLTIINSILRGSDSGKPLIEVAGRAHLRAQRSTLTSDGRGPALSLSGSSYVGWGSADLDRTIVRGTIDLRGDSQCVTQHCAISPSPPPTVASEELSTTPTPVDELGRLADRSDVGPAPDVRVGAE
jgi:hypothetical protein